VRQSAIVGYHKEAGVTDILIRDIPDEVIAMVDTRAARLGISRSEYIRRRLAQDVIGASKVSVADLKRFAEDFGDLADPDVMAQAWR
jgi:plasmid stability protein